MNFRRIKLSQSSTKKLQIFKGRTGLTPNIACRVALGLSLSQRKPPSKELYFDESGQEINRYTLFGEHEHILTALYKQWCVENKIKDADFYPYFISHINYGVELLYNRVKGLEDFVKLIE